MALFLAFINGSNLSFAALNQPGLLLFFLGMVSEDAVIIALLRFLYWSEASSVGDRFATTLSQNLEITSLSLRLV